MCNAFPDSTLQSRDYRAQQLAQHIVSPAIQAGKISLFIPARVVHVHYEGDAAYVIRKRSNSLSTLEKGFTLTELIVVLLIVGVLAISVVPRFLNTRTFTTRSYFDQSIQIIRYGQKAAVAQGRTVFVNVDANSKKICLTYVVDTDCSSSGGVVNPSDRSSTFTLTAPSDVTLSGSRSFSFTALGVPNPNAAVSLTVTGDGAARTITVEQETGYVH